VCLFLKRALAQEFLHILFTGQRAFGLIMKFRFVLFFRGFHSTNRDVCARNPIPPTIQSARNRVIKNRRLYPRSLSFFSQRCAWRSSASAMRNKIPRRFSSFSSAAKSR
jgi:hypothetical protein